MKDPTSDAAKTIALVNSDPKKYKLSVTCARYFPKTFPKGTWTRDKDGKFLNAKAVSYDGTEWNPDFHTVISPLAPDSLWEECGRGRAEPLAAVRKKAPISIVLNGGEFGLGIWGFAGKAWKKDPRIVKAYKDHGCPFDYLSARKARAEKIIADAVREAVPDMDHYIYYTVSGNGHRHRWGGWWEWGYAFKHMRIIQDLSSAEHYCNHGNTGWVGKRDILSLALNGKGVVLSYGHPLAYSWFWCRNEQEDMTRYIGFLKCIYVMGTIGGNAGAYGSHDFKSAFKPEQAPSWMKQMIALSRVHAFFSHLEAYLRNGELLPGEYRHHYSVENPAYELVPEELKALAGDKKTTPFVNKTLPKQIKSNPKAHKDKNGIVTTLKMGRPVRVLVRKHKTKNEALLVAWAAEGKERQVTVDVPGFGKVQVLARPGGSVYRISGSGENLKTHLFDVNQNYPSISFKQEK